jgi:hypothetical protein
LPIRRFVFTLLIAIPTISLSQSPTCKDVRSGIFYTYWPKSGDHFVSIMHGDTLTEIIGNLNDTVRYRVNWTDECAFSIQYLSGGSKLSKRILDFNKEHIFWNKIEKITDEYFVSRMNQDKPSGRMLKRDTSWFVQKIDVAVNNSNFQKLSGPLVDRKVGLGDTANYALVYVYRPSRVMLWLATYPLYFNNEVMCVVQNNAGYIFRVNKEGLHRFSTQVLDDESAVTVDIKFGQKYFLKPSIDWGVYRHLANCKLRLEHITDEQVAMKEFSAVKLR